MSDQFRIIASVYRGLIDILREEGLNSAAISEQLGCDIQRVTAPSQMLDLEQVTTLWKLGYETRGASIGIDVAGNIRLVDFQDIGVFLTATENAADLLRQLENYSGLFSNVMQFKVTDTSAGLEVSIDYHATVPLMHERLEFLALAAQVLTSQYLESPLKLAWVELSRPRPADTQRWDQAFGTTVKWNTTKTRYLIRWDEARRQVLTRNEPLKQNLQLLLDSRLRQDKNAHPLDEIQTVMMQQLESQQVPCIETVAEALHVSARTLQRRLGAADTTFSDLLSSLRESAAKNYVELGWPAIEVAEKLGYTDVRTFTRAFKRWVGMTPSQYSRVSKAR